MTNKKLSVVYDIEQTVNFHSIVALNVRTMEIHQYIIHESQNDIKEYYYFIKRCDIMIGYNNTEFDYILIHYILTNAPMWIVTNTPTSTIIRLLYLKTQEIIRKKYNIIKEPLVKQIDLYKIYHFDNANKRTSLKHLQFVLRLPNMMSMPFDHTHMVQVNEIPMIMEYNINDVMATYQFLMEPNTIKAIKLRNSLTEEFGIDMTNMNDPAIASAIFKKRLSEELGITESTLSKQRTIRNQIVISECINKHDYPFKEPCFIALFNYFNSLVITNTKGVMSDIILTDNTELKELTKYVSPNTIKRKKKHKVLTTLNVYYNKLQIDYGLGGLHASQPAGIYSSNNDYLIVDVDVESFYPNIAIVKQLYPEHLTEYFCTIYNDIFYKRKATPKGTPMNMAYKLMLNGTYGKSNDEYSFFYDPKYTMSITINGQLSLSLLAEQVSTSVDCSIIQMNTDGITFKVKRNELDTFYDVCKKWEQLTKYKLEYVNYTKMIIRDVNNYIAVYENTTKEPKCKGAFELKPDYHKNHSAMIVRKAIVDYFVNGTPVERTILDATDLYDFYIHKKVDKRFKLIGVNTINGVKRKKLLDSNLRYYITNGKGLSIYKLTVDSNRRTLLFRGYKAVVTNKHPIKHINQLNINYNYYIGQALKTINNIEYTVNQSSLF